MKGLVVVTGGSKGIGKSIILRFAAEGYSIATCARGKSSMEELKNEVLSLYPTISFDYFVADLSIKTDRHAFVQFVLGLHTSVDVLVNNTGVFTPGKIQEEADGDLERLMQTNVYSAYDVTRGLLPSIIKVRGHVFTICSTASIMPYINGGSYCITKHALLGFNKVLREEMKEHQVRVTSVLPGATRTASWDGVDLPEERFIDPNDVAESILGAYYLSKRTVIEELLIRPQLGDI